MKKVILHVIDGLKNICPIDEYTMIKVHAKVNGIYFCKKCKKYYLDYKYYYDAKKIYKSVRYEFGDKFETKYVSEGKKLTVTNYSIPNNEIKTSDHDIILDLDFLKNKNYIKSIDSFEIFILSEHSGHEFEQFFGVIKIYERVTHSLREVVCHLYYHNRYECFFIDAYEFNQLYRIGIPICKSLLGKKMPNYLGYNVNSVENVDIKERLIILYFVIENGFMTKQEVLDYIGSLIKRGKNNSKYSNAVRRWREDYKLIEQKKFDYKRRESKEIRLYK